MYPLGLGSTTLHFDIYRQDINWTGYIQNICIKTYRHVITTNQKRGHELEREQGGVYGRRWSEETEDKWYYVIISKVKEIMEKLKISRCSKMTSYNCCVVKWEHATWKEQLWRSVNRLPFLFFLNHLLCFRKLWVILSGHF